MAAHRAAASARRCGAHRRPNPHTGTGRRTVALATATGLSAAGLLLTAGPASAEDPVSQAQGRFLDGTVLGLDLNSLLAVLPARATNVGPAAQVFHLNPLDLDLLNAIPISLGPVNLPGRTRSSRSARSGSTRRRVPTAVRSPPPER